MEYFFDTIICDLTPVEKVYGVNEYTKYYFDFHPTLFVGFYNIGLIHRLVVLHGDSLVEDDSEEGHKAMCGILELLKNMPVYSVAKEDCVYCFSHFMFMFLF